MPYRFGAFRFDVDRLELTRDGRPLSLQRQPALVLATLLARAGQLVSREDLRRVVWGDDTHVDFDRGLNFCIAQIRTALSDSAESPRYVRTLSKRGYEFIGEVRDESRPAESEAEATAGPTPSSRRRVGVAWILSTAAVAAIVVLTLARLGGPWARPIIVAVARFDNETGNSALTRFSDSLTDSLVADLTADGQSRYAIIGNAALLRVDRSRRDLRAIAQTLHARYVILGQVQGDDAHLRVLAHLIRLPDQTHVAVSRTEPVESTGLSNADDLAAKIARMFDARLRDRSLGTAPPARAGE